ncbi:MAG TPA: sulfotransferase [Steroidobacteraceae bacterium]
MRDGPRPADLLHRGVRAAEQGRVQQGLALIREACSRDPADAEALAQLGRWLSKLHRQAEALAAVERALQLQPQDGRTLDTIGVVLSRAGAHERAVECFDRAVAAWPTAAGPRFNQASSLKFLGRFAEAEAAYEACIARDPRHWRAHAALAQLRPQTHRSNHVARLAALLAEGELSPDDELTLRHALAKELEDLGRHEEAFTHLQLGKARRRATLDYDFERDRRLFEQVQAAFGDVVPAPARAASGPIFVVGMPRTGTTLVERILSSHSQVASAGESQNFGVLLKRATGTPSPRVLDEATLQRSRSADFAELGRRYVEQTRPSPGRPRFVDKMPLNFFYLGAIARALPDASLVVMRRNPLDAGLGNFRQLFATHFRYYDYALDLRDIARYYAAFDRLVAHWRRVLPGRVHEIAYERLVSDPQGETERLLQHCGLAWEAGCLEFEKNPAPVSTASAVQVRRPLETGGIGRWRRFERQLQPLIAELQHVGIDLRPDA